MTSKIVLVVILVATTISYFTTVEVLALANISQSVGGNNSSNGSTINSSSFPPTVTENKVHVVASFYPIFEFVKNVGGDRVRVSSLIPVGTEPHDFEPSVQQIQNAEASDMIVFNGAGFEGSRIENMDTKFVVDTSEGLNLTLGTNEHAEDEEELNKASFDPHIWLDPQLAKQQVKKIRDGLIKIDPSNAAYYNKNAMEFISELDNLDKTIKSELSSCEKKDFIAFHDAFSYFAERYGLTQHSMQGLSPEAEVLPQRLQQVIALARDTGLDTIYSEELIDPRFADVIAQEIPNGKVLVLSPIEGLTKQEQNAGIGYLDKMMENIENLKLGLKCN